MFFFFEKANPAVVTALDQRLHQLEDDDLIKFREVKGMAELNGKVYKIKGFQIQKTKITFQFKLC